jgi:hypothetical protein
MVTAMVCQPVEPQTSSAAARPAAAEMTPRAACPGARFIESAH